MEAAVVAAAAASVKAVMIVQQPKIQNSPTLARLVPRAVRIVVHSGCIGGL
jgi:hypothetical protein